MPAYRLFDLFNTKIGATQIVGAESWGVQHGFRTIQSNNDGFAGVAARDRTYFHAGGSLAGQDIGSFGTLVGLFESTDDNLDIIGEGKVAGDALKSASLQLKRAKLVGASLSFAQGQHALTRFDFRNTAAAASTAPEDEVPVVEIASKTITHAAGYRGVRIKSGVSFDPDGADPAIAPLGITGLDLDLRWQVGESAGDDDFGMVVEAAGPELTGALLLQDLTLTGGQTVAQQLMAATWGVLTIPYTQQGGQADKTITLNNVIFEEEAIDQRARIFHTGRVPFSCFFQNGATAYKFGAGSNKIYAVA